MDFYVFFMVIQKNKNFFKNCTFCTNKYLNVYFTSCVLGKYKNYETKWTVILYVSILEKKRQNEAQKKKNHLADMQS